MRVAALVCALCAAGAARSDDFALTDWMGQLRPMIDNLTLLDLSVPGSHDTMTYDLSTTISDDANDLPPALASFLHDFGWILPSVTEFVRDQAVTQVANITEQLEGGSRFVDFRIIRTKGPKLGDKEDWYNLHLVESKQPSITYLKEIRAWMDAHPQEVVTFWMTRHGSCQAGQFPNITDAQMQAYYGAMEEVFGDMMIDTTVSALANTTYAQLIERNHRVVIFIAEGPRFYGGKTTAFDGCLVDNRLGGAGADNVKNAINDYKAAQGVIDANKPAGKYYLKSMASSGGSAQIGAAALEKYLHIKAEVKKCAESYHIPNLTDWCPATLLEQERLVNYYNQIALESVVRNLKRGVEARYPNAIYIDAVSRDGLIRTGVDGNSTEGYAYSASVILTNLWRACGGVGGTKYPRCAAVEAQLEALRARNPFKQVDNQHYGRLTGWPVDP